MTLIVVTLLAATLIVVVPTWKRLLAFLEHTPLESRRVSFQVSAVFIGPSVLATLASYFSLLISPDTRFHYVPDVFVLMVFALTWRSVAYGVREPAPVSVHQGKPDQVDEAARFLRHHSTRLPYLVYDFDNEPERSKFLDTATEEILGDAGAVSRDIWKKRMLAAGKALAVHPFAGDLETEH